MCTHFSLSPPCQSLWRKSLCPVCSCPLGTGMLQWGSPESSLFRGEKTLRCFSRSSWGKSFSSSAHLCGTSLQSFYIFFKFCRPELGTVYQDIPIPIIQANISLYKLLKLLTIILVKTVPKNSYLCSPPIHNCHVWVHCPSTYNHSEFWRLTILDTWSNSQFRLPH